MTAPTHLLVANPTAQSGRNAARIDRALRALAAAGLPTRLLPTAPHGGTISAVRDALDGSDYRCVIAMGGDGTFREVGEALLSSTRREEVTLGMLPAGTANNHGRTFGLDVTESALERNVAVLAAAHETRLDAGDLHATDADGRTVLRATFFDSVGFGIGASIIAARNIDRARIQHTPVLRTLYQDDLVYAGALLRILASGRRTDIVPAVSVVTDGDLHPFRHLSELLVRGTRVYAGGWVVDPTSRHDDGLFEVFPFPSRLAWLTRAAIGLHGHPLLRAGLIPAAPPPGTLRASRIDIHFHAANEDELPAGQMDGEELPRAPRFSIRVLPRAIRLVVPSISRDDGAKGRSAGPGSSASTTKQADPNHGMGAPASCPWRATPSAC